VTPAEQIRKAERERKSAESRPTLTMAGWRAIFQPQLDDLAQMIRSQRGGRR